MQFVTLRYEIFLDDHRTALEAIVEESTISDSRAGEQRTRGSTASAAAYRSPSSSAKSSTCRAVASSRLASARSLDRAARACASEASAMASS